MLGGNIGIPIVERLLELTPGHRVVDELSELQLPTLSRGTTVAVYTNVTSDHLDRHGSLEAYRRVKRRLAELVDPAGALVLNAEDPVVAGYAGARDAPGRSAIGATRPSPGGLGVVDGWIVADGVERLPLAGERRRGDRSRRPDHARRRAGDPRRPQRLERARRDRGRPRCSGSQPDAIRVRRPRRSPASSTASSRSRVIDGVRFINDSQGTQPDAVIAALRAFEPPIVLIAGGRDKGIDLAALAPVVAERAVAAVLIGESGPTLEAAFRAAGLARTERATDLEDAVAPGRRHRARGRWPRRPGAGPATVLLSPAAASFDMFVDYAARGPGVQGGRRGPGRGPQREEATDEPRPADPAPRAAPPDAGARRRDRADWPIGRPVKSRARRGPSRASQRRLRDPRGRRRPDRDRHPDGLLVVGAQGLHVAGRRHVRDRRSADPVGDPGHRRDGADDAGRLPLPAPRLGAVLHRRGRPAGARLRARSSTSSSAVRRAGSSSDRCRRSIPPRSPSSRWSSTWRTGSPSGASGSTASGPARSPFLIIAAPIIALVFKEPDLGTTVVITLTAFTMFFVAGANLVHLAVMGGVGFLAMIVVGLQGYQLERIRVWQDPWLDRLGAGFHTIQGLLALGIGGLFGTGLGESKVFVPNAFNDFIFAEVGQEFGLVGAIVVIGLFLILAYSGVRVALGAPDTFGALLGGRDHSLAVPPGVHQHRCGRGAAADHRDHAAVHQCRRVIAHHQLRGGRDPVVDLARDRGKGDVERRCDC